eukprot:TRINITY_DN27052_c3_g2_i1.p1 TRINITY_DN27052_c3_g2~~TRINITY_DN27052_c3_g2_i1.p1  ORF type:complete len:888 (-),score=173.99 TRINITY_DN27052_c3_g2_i1:134-2797(-)
MDDLFALDSVSLPSSDDEDVAEGDQKKSDAVVKQLDGEPDETSGDDILRGIEREVAETRALFHRFVTSMERLQADYRERMSSARTASCMHDMSHAPVATSQQQQQQKQDPVDVAPASGAAATSVSAFCATQVVAESAAPSTPVVPLAPQQEADGDAAGGLLVPKSSNHVEFSHRASALEYANSDGDSQSSSSSSDAENVSPTISAALAAAQMARESRSPVAGTAPPKLCAFFSDRSKEGAEAEVSVVSPNCSADSLATLPNEAAPPVMPVQQSEVSNGADDRPSTAKASEESKSSGDSDSVGSVEMEVTKPAGTFAGRAGARSSIQRLNTAIMMNLESAEEAAPSWLKRVVESSVFSFVCLMMIVANSVFIGAYSEFSLQTEIGRIRTPDRDVNSEIWTIGEFLFCGYFTFELLIRFFSSPLFFVTGPDWRWNLFDFILVLNCAIDLIVKEMIVDAGSLTYIRILRIVRMARILRMIRVMRFFRSLRLMVYSIFHSLLSLLWVFLLMVFGIYVFSIFIMSQLLEYVKERVDFNRPAVPQDDVLLDTFGTVFNSVVTLFSSICGGWNWIDLYIPLFYVNPFVGCAFIFYIFFVVFGVLNVVTGAFVDSMRLVSERDRDAVVEAELKKADKLRDTMEKIFMEADVDGSGLLSWEEFEAHLGDERVRAYFQTLEIDVSQAKALFLLLDIDESDEVPINRFVDGCMRMRGSATSIDVNMLLYENEKMLAKIHDFTEYAEDKFETIERKLDKHAGNTGQERRAAAVPLDPSVQTSMTSTRRKSMSVQMANVASKTSITTRLDAAVNLMNLVSTVPEVAPEASGSEDVGRPSSHSRTSQSRRGSRKSRGGEKRLSGRSEISFVSVAPKPAEVQAPRAPAFPAMPKMWTHCAGA